MSLKNLFQYTFLFLYFQKITFNLSFSYNDIFNTINKDKDMFFFIENKKKENDKNLINMPHSSESIRKDITTTNLFYYFFQHLASYHKQNLSPEEIYIKYKMLTGFISTSFSEDSRTYREISSLNENPTLARFVIRKGLSRNDGIKATRMCLLGDANISRIINNNLFEDVFSIPKLFESEAIEAELFIIDVKREVVLPLHYDYMDKKYFNDFIEKIKLQHKTSKIFCQIDKDWDLFSFYNISKKEIFDDGLNNIAVITRDEKTYIFHFLKRKIIYFGKQSAKGKFILLKFPKHMQNLYKNSDYYNEVGYDYKQLIQDLEKKGVTIEKIDNITEVEVPFLKNQPLYKVHIIADKKKTEERKIIVKTGLKTDPSEIKVFTEKKLNQHKIKSFLSSLLEGVNRNQNIIIDDKEETFSFATKIGKFVKKYAEKMKGFF
jgi:hypothetical protein